MGASKKQQKISLISFNTLGTPFFAPYITKRYRNVAEYINNADVDIVCLYELFTYYHFYLFQKKLTNFPFAIYSRNIFGPRGGVVIFSKIPLVNTVFTDYKYRRDTYIPFYNRIACHGILSAQIEGFPVRILASHLSSDTTHSLTPKNKLYNLIHAQSQQAAELVNNYTQKGHSIVFAVDFNIAKHSTLYEEFLNKTIVQDVFAKDDFPTYYPDRVSYFYRSPESRCDFVFFKSPNKKIKVLDINYAFIEKEKLSNGDLSYLSDHIGLHCILEVNE